MIEVSGRSPFLSSFPHPETLHLRYLNMGTRTAPATGRHIVVSKNTYYTANTVSRIFYDVNVLVNETHCMDFGTCEAQLFGHIRQELDLFVPI